MIIFSHCSHSVAVISIDQVEAELGHESESCTQISLRCESLKINAGFLELLWIDILKIEIDWLLF